MSAVVLTLPDLVRRRAASDDRDRIAYTFLTDGRNDAQSITWSQLHERAVGLAALWRERGVTSRPVLLAMASGLRFVEALLACWYAGAIAVPVSLPRHARVKHRLDLVVGNANAKYVIGLPETRPLFASMEAATSTELSWLDPYENAPLSDAASCPSDTAQPVALLQYTSGSTGTPRGVIVTHANLMHNSAVIATACGHGPGQTIGGWLPLFHDMGLVGLLIQAAYSGARCVFMSPERFLMRPWSWLQMITDYNICSSPAPNFAYDFCVDRVTEQQKTTLDLRGWKTAINGAEPVRARTLERFTSAFRGCGFSRAAFFPCYGLAESTLLVTGVRVSSGQLNLQVTDAVESSWKEASGRVGCGPALGDSQIAIADPQTNQPVATGEIGEIWVASSSCAQGYWNDPTATQMTFKARLGGSDTKTDQRDWLRTGDLGFIKDGQLFVTGRIRDLIIIAGRNLFPADLEQTAESSHPAVASSGAAAFSIEMDHTERLVLAVELRRDLSKLTLPQAAQEVEMLSIRRRVIEAITSEYGVTPFEVLLLRAGALPRTTSGKLRRVTTRDQYLGQTLAQFEFSKGDSSHVGFSS